MLSKSSNLWWKVLVICLTLTLLQCQVTWTDLPQIRMGQTSIYDTIYIPVNTLSTLNVTFKTPFLVSSPAAHQAAVISGFQNYLHYQININVTMPLTYQDKVTLNFWIGGQTYIKQLRVNYFVMQPGSVGNLDTFIDISIGNYRTLDLDDITGPRTQVFNNQTTPFATVFSICSAIHGLEYYNSDGTVNELNVNTQIITSPIIQQTVYVGEKGRLNYISITTILISTGFYPTPNTYVNLGYTFPAIITNTGSGLQIFQAISGGGLFTSTQNSIFFGIRGFNFTMEGTRLFLLDIATQTNFTKNLFTNTFMKETELSVLLISNRGCTNLAHFYYVQGFTCVPACTNLMADAINKLCFNCSTVCSNGCTNNIGNCTACKSGNNRIDVGGSTPTNCVCNYTKGYVEVQKQDVCQLCSDLISGCVKCATPTSCDDCGNTTIYVRYQVGTDYKCKCLGDKYLVTGVCLSYPGCLEANKYVTGGFCEKCDTASNFQKNLTNNSSCVCMTAYFPSSNVSYCEDRCGDSKTPSSPLNATQTQIICDDGNKISGDGCSSTCRQQYGYLCTIKQTGGVSNCAYKQEIKINYLYAQKNLIANQGTLVFALLPAQNFLAESTFQTAVNIIKNPGIKKVKFDPVNSLILITIDYTETLEGGQYQFDFSFTGLSIYSPQINVKATLWGKNAKLQISKNHQQVNIITYVALAVAAFALVLALTSAFLGQKMMGIELILPVQAAFFSMATFPQNILSPISALWSLKYSNGYNVLDQYDLKTNYMLDSRVNIMQYGGQYLLNYNIMFLLLALVILIIGVIAIRIAWLEKEEKRLQELQKKKEDEEKDGPKKKVEKPKEKEKEKQKPSSTNQKTSDQQSTTQQTQKAQDQINLQQIEQQLQDARENIKNWKNFLYMIFDRFLAILIITSMMKIIFCFYIQLSNLTYTAEPYDNSLNAGFFFVSYATILTGLYAILYDYKNDKLIVFTCNKGKYAIFYICIFLGFIVVLGAVFETFIAVYVGIVFAVMPLVLIPYQKPYGFGLIDFQNIIGLICQLPFMVTMAVSLLLSFQKESMQQSTSLIFAYAIIGSVGLSIIMTIIRLIKVVDCKKISCVEFTDRKKQNANDKNKKKNKVALLDLDKDKEWDEDSQDSVRAVLQERKKHQEDDIFSIDDKNKEGYQAIAQKKEAKPINKEKLLQEDDDEDIDELQKIKMKLRKQLKQKKVLGKIK